MPRKGHVPRRVIISDPVYNHEMVARFVNKIMKDGKKGLAQRLFYQAMDKIAEKTGKPAIDVFEEALKNVMPMLEVRPRRVGGATYQVPMEVRPERRISLAMRWLTTAARARNERTMVERLANELIDAANNTGVAVKKREDVHKMAEANRPFAHYRW